MVRETLAKQQYGHVPTRTSATFMRNLLGNASHYSNIDDSIGIFSIKLGKNKDWQQHLYENLLYDSMPFFGEPEYGMNKSDAFSFSYKIGIWNFNWGFSYHFKGRRNKTKGVITDTAVGYGTNINMDRLYYILVNRFNHGEDFIRVFLQIVVPALMADKLNEIMFPVMNNIIGMTTKYFNEGKVRYTTSGQLDKRYKATKAIEKAINSTFNSSLWQEKSDIIEHEIKDLFIQSMETGTVSGHAFIRHTNEDSTIAKKVHYYGDKMSEFVASKQFINAIVFDLVIKVS